VAAVPAQGRPALADAGALYERHYANVLAYCRRRLNAPEDAEDAAQITFLHAHRSLQRGAVPIVEAPWLFRIAQNVCVERWRANGRRKQLEAVGDPCALDDVAARRETAEFSTDELRAALSRLTENQRRAILMREWQGLRYSEIAAELDLTVEAVEALLFRSRRSLANELTADRGPRRLRGGLNVGSLLGWAKSFFSGGVAAKLAAAVALTTTALGGTTVALQLHGRPHTRPVPPRATSAETSRGLPHALGNALGPVQPRRGARHDAIGNRPSQGPPAPREADQPTAPRSDPVTGSAPAVTVPAPSLPSAPREHTVGVPSVAVPTTPALPTVAVPTVTVPNVTVPLVSTPAVSTPSVTVPKLP
jgi:RNA polymerase sigma-70 factor (ECF subfamily)